MILCVTLNPCLDKTLLVPSWEKGDSVRGLSIREVVGGKGNNVARALKRLGREDVSPVTFLGGDVGERCASLLSSQDSMQPVVVATQAPTREILTVRTQDSDDQTAFFDPDPQISAAEAQSLLEVIDGDLRSNRIRALTLSGSSPSPTTHGTYSELIALAQARNVPTFLDTYGPSLEAIWGFWPTVLQLNLREAAMHLGLSAKRPTDEQVVGLLDRWSKRGVQVAVVTDGPNRFLARVRGTTFRVKPPAIEPVNPIGSGDCFLAGLVDGHFAQLDATALLKHATSCAVANALVWDAGAVDPEIAGPIADMVVVERVD